MVRPLYWWAKDLRRQGYVLGRMHFDVSAMAATVSMRLPSYRVVEVVHRHDDKPRLPFDLPALLAEAVWRLGALGWTDEARRAGASSTQPRPHHTGAAISGAAHSADPGLGDTAGPGGARRVLVGCRAAGPRWRLHACGEPIARGGFIAEVPGVGGAPVLAVYRSGILDDGTEGSALANCLARLTAAQRQFVQRVIADATAGEGRVL